jgi:hypothetical protein
MLLVADGLKHVDSGISLMNDMLDSPTNVGGLLAPML